ncbi:phytoene synthase [Lactobacillus plantarum JDM1] [Lactiplantibacillus mudanjiangensis]|uniref:phytoene/squalene synthase family protein n=1 Tax=Lactiplantibacillus mudanjiangensis TaxID=1296538 RepID=UPI001014DE66|nr:phytoene/squalene synthase family protein [Lactiplantibacillus mudanjiangensis]VDG30864.1 phytoene synthase [Lactobacillus plantarum JDM1] [Lactiplantibacillus mudanjiangensis]
MTTLNPTLFETNRAAFEICAAITKRASQSFYTAFSHLPRHRAWSIYAVYAFCRTADDLIDVHHDLAGLEQLQQELVAFTTGEVPAKPMWEALAVVFATYDMDHTAFFDMLQGQRQDATFTQPTTSAALTDYRYYVAGSVGLMILPILSSQHRQIRQSAIALGSAMQLTNILRDVGEDYQQGRIYLPKSQLIAHGVTNADFETVTPSDHFIALWEATAKVAEQDYQQGLTMLPLIDDAARPALMAATYLYREILTVAREQGYAVLTQRTVVPKLRQAQVLRQVQRALKQRA